MRLIGLNYFIDPLGLDSSKPQELAPVTITGQRANPLPTWVGPTFVILGQPLNFLKPIGAAGSSPGSSIASWGLSKVFPQTTSVPKQVTKKVLSKVVGKTVGKRIAYKLIGTTTIGRILGRLVPGAGWTLTALDAWHYREEIKEFIGDVKNENTQKRNDLIWHVR